MTEDLLMLGCVFIIGMWLGGVGLVIGAEAAYRRHHRQPSLDDME